MSKGRDGVGGKHSTVGPWQGSLCSWPCLEWETRTRTTVALNTTSYKENPLQSNRAPTERTLKVSSVAWESIKEVTYPETAIAVPQDNQEPELMDQLPLITSASHWCSGWDLKVPAPADWHCPFVDFRYIILFQALNSATQARVSALGYLSLGTLGQYRLAGEPETRAVGARGVVTPHHAYHGTRHWSVGNWVPPLRDWCWMKMH